MPYQRPQPPKIIPPGSIPALGLNRPVVSPAAIRYVPQPTGATASPGKGPGFALADHIHVGGTGGASGGGGGGLADFAVRTDASHGLGSFSDTGMAAGAADFTVRFAVQPSLTVPPGGQTLFGIGNRPTNNFFQIDYFTSGIRLGTAGGGSPVNHSFTIFLGDGNWHWLVVTSTGGQFTLVVDNVVIGTWTSSPQTSLTGTAVLGLNGSGDNPCPGFGFDEFDYSTAALTLAQLSAAYNARANGQYANRVQSQSPIRYYRFGEATGPTFFDSSTSLVNGTYNNGVVFRIPGATSG